MTPDEARAELAAAFLEGTVGDVLVESDVERIIDAMLARPELVLAALGTEEVGYQRDPSWRRLFMLPEGTEKP